MHGFDKETVTAIMMLYKNTKVKVCSPDGDTDSFDIFAGILQGDTLLSYLFIIGLNYVLRTSIDLMKENSFTRKKRKKEKSQEVDDTPRKVLRTQTTQMT